MQRKYKKLVITQFKKRWNKRTVIKIMYIIQVDNHSALFIKLLKNSYDYYNNVLCFICIHMHRKISLIAKPY